MDDGKRKKNYEILHFVQDDRPGSALGMTLALIALPSPWPSHRGSG